jgi:hypothetical protein
MYHAFRAHEMYFIFRAPVIVLYFRAPEMYLIFSDSEIMRCDLYFRAPEVYPLVFREAFTPLSLLRSSRKAVWAALRRNAGGRTIQTGLRQLESELPKTLFSFLKFETH